MDINVNLFQNPIDLALERLEKNLKLHHEAFQSNLNALKFSEEQLFRESIDIVNRLKSRKDINELCNFNELYPNCTFEPLKQDPREVPSTFDESFWKEYRFNHCDGKF